MTTVRQEAGATVRAAIRDANDEGRAALIVYLPAGYPGLEESQACLEAAAEGGADLLEVGFPYSDPLMDGATIQAANQVALDAGHTPADDFALCGRLTRSVGVPALVMTYYNLAWHYGGTQRLGEFARAAADSGLAGAILPDLPVAEGGPWIKAADEAGLATAFLVAPSSTDARLAEAAAASSGFVYATSTMGVTGERGSLSAMAEPLVARVRQHAEGADAPPVCVGIGVSTAAHAEEVAGFADGVIVGSAAVRAAGSGGPRAVRELAAGLAEGCRRGYRS